MGQAHLQIAYHCPRCEQSQRQTIIDPAATQLTCPDCGWSRSLSTLQGAPNEERGDAGIRREAAGTGAATAAQTPVAIPGCAVCGCDDLWRQKDFPQQLGVIMVAVAAICSTIAFAYYRPLVAIGILMGFALVDFSLYAFMRDVLVCYRCGARYRNAEIDAEHRSFNLETHERYRQEAIRRGD